LMKAEYASAALSKWVGIRRTSLKRKF
jgi:hypothetical protein